MRYLVAIAFVISAGCAMKTKILDASAISMTYPSLKEGQKLQETGPVKGEFCSDTFGDKGQIGLIDECVKSAQAKTGVDYIMNASFWHEGKCVSVEGTGAKVVGSADLAPMATPAKAKKKQ